VTATIKYDRPVANYIDRITATGHVTNTPYKKTSVTIHHNGGRLSLDGIYQVWRQRRASAHFQVDAKGDVGQYVDVRMYAWATGNTQGNKSSISIEQAQYDAFTKAPPPKPDPKPVPVTPANVVAKTRSLQKLVEVTSDGKWSDLTDDRAQRMRTAALVHTYAGRLTFDVRDVQRVLDVTVDGDWGPNTQKALEKWVPQAQRVIGVEDDGVWGPGTEKAFWDFRKLAYNKF
jgi:hypothetical protein